jgi:hypothetical protein
MLIRSIMFMFVKLNIGSRNFSNPPPKLYMAVKHVHMGYINSKLPSSTKTKRHHPSSGNLGGVVEIRPLVTEHLNLLLRLAGQ